LADDLERYLEGRPVLARPPTVRYRLHKFVRRNWAAVSSAAVAIVILMGLVGGLFRQTRQLEQEQEISERQRRRAEEVTRFLIDSFGSARPPDGREVTARQVLDGAIDQLEKLEREPELQALLLDTMGSVYEALELHETAERLYGVSLETRVEILGEEHLDVATSHANLGRALAGSGDAKRAEPHLRRALELRRRGLSSAHPATAASLRDLGRLLTDLGELSEAESVLEESLRLHRRLFGEEHDDTAAACLDLARVLERQGELEEAEELLLTAFSTLRRLGGIQDPATLRARDRIILFYETRGRPEEAARYRDGR
jgi:serine/threonine-protein kinase